MLPTFRDPALLVTALTHRSALNEKISSSVDSNERFEFLGDAVLELAATKHLFDNFPQEQEGVLTAYRSALVKTTTLAEVATQLGLGQQLYLSKGEEATGGRENVSLLADTFEAVVGALYLDQGFEAAETFLSTNLFPKFDTIQKDKSYRDPKSELQELVQSQGFSTPLYTVIQEHGPDHDKQFTIQVSAGGKILGQGTGKSKQAAQQAAAAVALEKVGS